MTPQGTKKMGGEKNRKTALGLITVLEITDSVKKNGAYELTHTHALSQLNGPEHSNCTSA